MNEIILKYLLGNMDSQSQLAFLKKIVSDAELKQRFNELQNIKACCSLASANIDETMGREAYLSFIGKMKRMERISFFKEAFKYVAIVFICIISTYWAMVFMTSNVAQQNSVYVPQGQRAQVTLQDGTTVWLNACSRLTYPSKFIGRERKVQLEGEAYFKVAKNHHVPFIVETKKIMMRVLGTQFDANCYPESDIQQINLYDGSVQVYFPNHKPESGVVLKPYQCAVVKRSRLYIKQMDNSDETSSWRNGILSFYNTKLVDITSVLEKYFGVTIHICNPKLSQVRYTGKFRVMDGAKSILQFIRSTYTFNIQYDDKDHIIYIK